MMIPITSSVCRELFVSVPRDIKEASVGLGATRWEMVRGVVLPSVRGGVVAAVTLGLGRALGEAIAVTQVIGNSLQPIQLSLFATGNTLASQLAANYQSSPTNIETASLVYLGADPARDHVHDEPRRAADRPPLRAAAVGGEVSAAPIVLKATGRSRRRLWWNRAAIGAAVLAAGLAVAVLAIVVGSVLARGWHALNADFFTKGPAVFGETGGGIAPALVGTLMLVAIATAMALPVGILVAIFVSEFAPKRIGEQIKLWLDVLNGFPSIIIGVFVFQLRSRRRPRSWASATTRARGRAALRSRSSWSRSSSRTTMEVLALVPNHLREASYALGVSKWRTVVSVVVPSALGGIVTGATLAVARAAGETAPLLFTCSIFGQTVSTDPSNSVASIPVIIFEYSESPDRHLNQQAWAAAFVLIAVVLVTSLFSRMSLERQRRKLGQVELSRPFTTPSPPRHSLAAHPRIDEGHAGRRSPTLAEGEGFRMKRSGLFLIALAALALLTAAAAGARHSATVINGAGSTFVSPLVSVWTPALGGAFDYTVQYSPIGSGGGIQAIQNRSVDFGASDAPLTSDQFSGCNGCVQIPWALAGTSIPYNIPGLVVPQNTNLRLSGTGDREDLHGPDHELERRGDQGHEPEGDAARPEDHPRLPHGNSGTTYNFTDYLWAVSPDWKKNIGTGQSVNWPAGTGASGSAGVAGVVQNTPGAICYVDTAFAVSSHLRFASIQNAAGKFISPSIRNVAAAGSAVTKMPGQQRAAHRQPAEVAPDRVSDRDLHVHHPPDEVVEGGRAPQDGLLGADPGPVGEVHGQALVRADPEERAGGVREDAQAGPARDVTSSSATPGVTRGAGRRPAPVLGTGGRHAV